MSAPDPSLPEELIREAREWCAAHDPSEENIARLMLARDERAARIARWYAANGATKEQIETAILSYKETSHAE
jgi:hypothetical protein